MFTFKIAALHRSYVVWRCEHITATLVEVHSTIYYQFLSFIRNTMPVVM